jgi:2-polyprenyl-3-methyl-5-hydroxy-6-metoxy-1,4-benzoquinol methylase
MSFRNRSYEKELLDRPGIPFEEIRLNMQELNAINRLLGGHSITLKAIRKLAGRANKLTVCEIGCGGGDNLAVINKWGIRQGIHIKCIGIDINTECIRFARQQFPSAEFIISDYKYAHLQEMPDIIFSSLFCHHFTNEELPEQLNWMRSNCRIGFFINDLHRHWLAYYSIRVLTAIFSNSRLVKNDAPLSVKRGFSRKEWLDLFERSGITEAEIKWNWAFRWLNIVRKSLNVDK